MQHVLSVDPSPLSIVVDYRLGGIPRRYFRRKGDHVELTPREVRDCVAFVCVKNLTTGEYQPKGTTFLVSVEGSSYFVTAAHVIKGIRDQLGCSDIFLRVNMKNAPLDYIPTKVTDWIIHPRPNVDVAMLPIDLSNEIDCIALPVETAASRENLLAREDREDAIAVSDAVFMTGLFVNHYGKEKNTPIIRVGNIAMLPEEPIKTRIGFMEAFLIEARSIGGLSGCPVFINISPQYGMSRRGGPSIYWLGLVHGHWDGPLSEMDAVAEEDAASGSINMGIAVVVPVESILGLINSPAFVTERRRKNDEKAIASAPRPD